MCMFPASHCTCVCAIITRDVFVSEMYTNWARLVYKRQYWKGIGTKSPCYLI